MTEPKAAYLRLSGQRREEIEHTVMRLYTENPFETVTAKVLCDALDINPATLYRWFDTKDDLYIYLQEKLAQKYASPPDLLWSMDDYATEDPTADGRLTAEEAAFAATWIRASDEAMRRFVFEDAFSSETCIRYNLERMQRSGEVRPGVDIELAAYIYNTLTYNIQRYYAEHHITDIEEAGRIKRYVFFDLLRLGIKGREPLPAEQRPETAAETADPEQRN